MTTFLGRIFACRVFDIRLMLRRRETSETAHTRCLIGKIGVFCRSGGARNFREASLMGIKLQSKMVSDPSHAVCQALSATLQQISSCSKYMNASRIHSGRGAKFPATHENRLLHGLQNMVYVRQTPAIPVVWHLLSPKIAN